MISLILTFHPVSSYPLVHFTDGKAEKTVGPWFMRDK